MVEVKVTEIGDSLGFVLPNEVLAKLRISKGDPLFLVPELDGYQLTTNDPTLAKQLEHVDDIITRYPNTLKQLAE